MAIVANTTSYVGPDLARPSPPGATTSSSVIRPTAWSTSSPATGAAVEVVDRASTTWPSPSRRPALVQAAVDRFGRVDAAVAASGRIVVGRFLKSTVDDLHVAVRGCLEAPYHFLRAVVPVMVEQGEGQVLVITSAAGARPTPGAPLYSSARAAANMLVRNVADEVAATGVQVNAVGTNFMDFPEFLAANGATDPEGRARVEAQVPMGRLGTARRVRRLLHAVPRRHQPVHDRPVRRLRRRLGLMVDTAVPAAPVDASAPMILDSLRRRMRAMHSLYEDATATMDLDHVNHFEREGVLPIAFSLFHYINMEDASFMVITGVAPDLERQLAGPGPPRHQRPRQAPHRRRDDPPADRRLRRVQGVHAAVFARTEAWLADLDPAELTRVVIPRPLPPQIASTYSARVAGDEGITVLDATECWLYQHGLRHMGEIELARGLVGLGGMTS